MALWLDTGSEGPGLGIDVASSRLDAGFTRTAANGVSKAALIAYSKGLATELAPHGVRVNTITPGSIQSPGGDSAREQIAATIGVEPAALLASIPVGHIGRPDDIAEAVAYLVSDRASFIIGANLIIDGGELPRT
jgi:NAD(P)-dependent dehydrogenase (short-subunit alcohol dehydrogenase family)